MVKRPGILYRLLCFVHDLFLLLFRVTQDDDNYAGRDHINRPSLHAPVLSVYSTTRRKKYVPLLLNAIFYP